MSSVSPVTSFEWAIAAAPLAGEHVSGDAAMVEQHQSDFLVAAIDGLGHGEEAAAAAAIAVDTVRANPAEPLDNILVLCHHALQSTRGAAVTLARVDTEGSALSWVGVGNVDAIVVRNTATGPVPIESPVLSGGIVGYNLPRVSVRTFDLRRGDLLVLATDGIDRRFFEQIRFGIEVAALADSILAQCAKGTDDALVFVSRFRGGDPDGPGR